MMSRHTNDAENREEDISPGFTKYSRSCLLQANRQEEDDDADNLLSSVALLACYLCVHGKRVVVVDCHLEEERVEHACREEEVADIHPDRHLADYHQGQQDDGRNEQERDIEVVLGREQLQYALAATHQSVDVVALVAHNHHERHHAQDNIVVETNERAHEAVVVHIAEVHDDAEQHHHGQADKETHAHRLVAKPLLDLELQVLAELAVAVQEVKLRGVLDFLLLLLSYLVVHHAHLQLVVCPIQQSNESANQERGCRACRVGSCRARA